MGKKIYLFLAVFVFTCSSFLVGCNDSSEEFSPYQKIISHEQDIEAPDENTRNTLESKLVSDCHKPESTASEIMERAEFEKWDIEVGRYWYTEKGEIPYTVKMKAVVWRSDDYFSLIDITDIEMKSSDRNFDFEFGENQTPWVDTTFLKIVPVNDSIPVIIGLGGNFVSRDTGEKLGPYTVLCNFTLSGYQEYRY